MPEFEPSWTIPGDVGPMVEAYLECAEWTEEDRLREEGEVPERWAVEAVEQAVNDCATFYTLAFPLGNDWSAEQMGRDLWLTRNGHGAGFWDRGREHGGELANIARGMGERSVDVGEDGLAYFG